MQPGACSQVASERLHLQHLPSLSSPSASASCTSAAAALCMWAKTRTCVVQAVASSSGSTNACPRPITHAGIASHAAHGVLANAPTCCCCCCCSLSRCCCAAAATPSPQLGQFHAPSGSTARLSAGGLKHSVWYWRRHCRQTTCTHGAQRTHIYACAALRRPLLVILHLTTW